MSVGSVITLGYGAYANVNFVPTLGYGNYDVVIAATPRDQGAGAGKRKLEYYRALGHQQAAKPKVKAESVQADPAVLPELIFIPEAVKGADLSNVHRELQKLQLAVSEEFLLQQEEERAIFMLMMMAV